MRVPKAGEVAIPPPPPMPSDAAPPFVDLAFGRGTSLQAWEKLWETGVKTGIDIGQVKAAVAVSLGWLAFDVALVAICVAIIRGRR